MILDWAELFQMLKIQCPIAIIRNVSIHNNWTSKFKMFLKTIMRAQDKFEVEIDFGYNKMKNRIIFTEYYRQVRHRGKH